MVSFTFGYQNNTSQHVCIAFADPLSDYGFEYFAGPSDTSLDCTKDLSGFACFRDNIADSGTGTVVFTAVIAPDRYDFGTLTNTAEFTIYQYVGSGCDWRNPLQTQSESADVTTIPDVIVDKVYTSQRNPQQRGDQVNFRLDFTNI